MGREKSVEMDSDFALSPLRFISRQLQHAFKSRGDFRKSDVIGPGRNVGVCIFLPFARVHRAQHGSMRII